jgi:nucleotide-binding universal stress UspA family protein
MNKTMQEAMKILVAVDGSDCGLAAVEEAARTPWPRGSLVKLLSVIPDPPVAAPWAPMPGVTYQEWQRSFEDRSLAAITLALARFAEIAGPETETMSKTVKGDARSAILEEAEHWGADLIILGTHGYHALERLWLGSVSRAVVPHAKCSVQIVRRPKTSATGMKGFKILLAIDGSGFSDEAARQIAGRPWPPGTEINILSVVELPTTTTEMWALPENYYSQLEESATEQAQKAIERAVVFFNAAGRESKVPVVLSTQIVVGRSTETILNVATQWNADLIVLGSHGKHAIERFLLGSVSHYVAYHGACSVEIVRRKTPAR